MAEDNKPKDPTAEESKELKKLLEAHVSVLTHQLKRAPTMEDMVQFLSEQRVPTEQSEAGEVQKTEQPIQEVAGEPKILSYKLYYGMKNNQGKREPDPNSVLFYERADGQCYDTSKHEWCQERPQIVDHLQSRELMFDEGGHDIMSAIVHGIMDDEDYAALLDADLLNDHHKKVWELNKQLQSQMAALQKSKESSEDESEEQPEPTNATESQPTEKVAASQSENGEDNFEPEAASLDVAGQEGGTSEDGDVAGENVFEQIVAAAMAEALDGALGDLENKIRTIVRDEISAIFGSSEPEQAEEPEQNSNT